LAASPGIVEAVAIDEGTGYLACGMDCDVAIWDLEDLRMNYRSVLHGRWLCLASG
jgi:hypothetical protein